MSTLPRISVVLATYKRAETLRETLRHLREQTLAPEDFEVIVIDDGSPDHTADIVEAARAECRFSMTYLHHANRGPGFTQNRGIRLARAPIVLLMADDIFMSPGALQAHLDTHARHPSPSVAVLGRVLQSPTLTGTVFLAKWNPFRLGDLPDGATLPYTLFWACNISLDREFMLAHGMFRDERGRGGAANHEDVELGYRLHHQGMQLVFAREALGHHHHVETLAGTLRRSYERGLNWEDFRRRVPEPEMDIRYRVYNLASLFARRHELSERREYLLGPDRSLARLSLIFVVRSMVFNRLTVHALWLPLFAAAERAGWLAALLRENMYRGVIAYYFLKGCRDGPRHFAALPRSNPTSS
ncbi:hypothetical protein BH11PSE9_BH11PSE9_20430 [soil metagenome]